MFAASLLFENGAGQNPQPRVRGGVRAVFRQRQGLTALSDCEERDGYKIRFPRGGYGCEGVIINTGGGVAGGDRVTHAVTLEDGASATLTSQAAERIYRSQGSAAEIDVALALGEGASLAWIPQETILFSQASFMRRLEIDMAANATLLMAEITVFGRKEMGETITQGRYADRWRVRRGGTLAFAENIRFEGNLDAGLKSPAVGNGARVAATVLYVAPAAEDKLLAVRNAIDAATSRIAASAWNGLLCIRCLGPELEAVRRDISLAICALRQQPMPRVWWT
jgi:urease accessory protein